MKAKVEQASTKLTNLQKLGLYFFDKVELTTLFWAAIVIFGLLSYTTLMQRQGFPNVDIPISVIKGTYFVNDKNIVDSKITKPISEAIKSLPEVKTVYSQSNDFSYLFTIKYNDGVSSKDGNLLVQNFLAEKSLLPKGATQEFSAIDAGRFQEQSDMLVNVTSDKKIPINELIAAADKVTEELKSVDGLNKAILFNQIDQGRDPVTGLNKAEITHFDRLGIKDGSGAIIFYPSVTIGLQAKADTDQLKLYDSVSKKIEELKQDKQFSGLKVSITADFAEGIRSQVSSLQQSLLEGLLVVIIVSCLLISFRAGIATALSMATVILATIGVLYAVGITLNTITLFGLILSLGLIVDDTTIMVEAIDSAKHSDSTRRNIAAGAIKKVARASFSGTLITMLAFAPMLFISGILGDFIRILPVTIIIALLISYIISLTLVPYLSRLLVSQNNKKAKFKNPIIKLEDYASNKLSKNLLDTKNNTKKRILYGGFAVLFSSAMFLASIPLFNKLKFDIFPSTKDSNSLSVAFRFKDAVNIKDAELIIDKANIIIGDTLGKNINQVYYQSSGSTFQATAYIKLTDYKNRTTKSPELVSQLQLSFKDFDTAEVKVRQVDAGPAKDDYPFAVRIFEEDSDKAYKLANNMKDNLLGKEINRNNGTKAKIVRTDVTKRVSVLRENGKRYVEVKSGFDQDDVSALVGAAKKLVVESYDNQKLSKFGINEKQIVYDFGNESNNQDSFKSMLFAFPILLIIMYVLLVVQFGSFVQPLLIFTAIPFSFFGVAGGLKITNNPLSFFVMVGFFALIGIAVNNTILLTDYANQARRDGKDVYESMALSLKARFRPLITTSLTSVLALIPLALTDPFWESLSYTLIFGLLSSTLLVVIAFPYYFLLGEWVRRKGAKLWKRQLHIIPQTIADILIAPVRVVRFLLWVIFTWRK